MLTISTLVVVGLLGFGGYALASSIGNKST